MLNSLKNMITGQKDYPGKDSKAEVVYYWKGIPYFHEKGFTKCKYEWGIRGHSSDGNARKLMDEIAEDIKKNSGINNRKSYSGKGFFGTLAGPSNKNEDSSFPEVQDFLNQRTPMWTQQLANLGWTVKFNFYEDYLERKKRGKNAKKFRRYYATGFIEYFKGAPQMQQPQGTAQFPQQQHWGQPQQQMMGQMPPQQMMNQMPPQQPMMNQMQQQPMMGQMGQPGFPSQPQNGYYGQGGYYNQQPQPGFGQVPQSGGYNQMGMGGNQYYGQPGQQQYQNNFQGQGGQGQ